MTTEKMPDVINITVSKNAVGVKDYQVSKLKPNTRYLRAKPVEELLEQVRDALYGVRGYWTTSNEFLPDVEVTNQLIIAIDKFLGEK